MRILGNVAIGQWRNLMSMRPQCSVFVERYEPNGTLLRQLQNPVFRRLAGKLIGEQQQALRAALPVQLERFDLGLYGNSEMLVEGLLHLIEAGVIKRAVACRSDPARTVVLHAAFFLGAPAFYRRLLALSDEARAALEMTGVHFVNGLDDDFALKSGKHDFVATARHLPDARSIIVLPSTRTKAGTTKSNISCARGLPALGATGRCSIPDHRRADAL